MPELNENVFVSARNIPSVLTSVLSDINTYDVMNADVLVLSESAAKLFSEMEEGAEA
jgi:large subunit ribosomal protein L4